MGGGSCQSHGYDEKLCKELQPIFSRDMRTLGRVIDPLKL